MMMSAGAGAARRTGSSTTIAKNSAALTWGDIRAFPALRQDRREAHRREVAIDLIGEAPPPCSSEAASGRRRRPPALAAIDQRISLKQNRRRLILFS
jgi:hypothetical protein